MQYGNRRSYAQAFVATDWLVERFGASAVVAYFRRAGVLLDGDRAFHESFAIALVQFDHAFGMAFASR